MNVNLECEAKSIPLDGIAHVKINVVYEADPGSSPITFHSHPFLAWGNQLYRRLEGDDWETIVNDTTGFMIVDDPDVAVNVTQDKNFATLQPGETWSTYEDVRGHGLGYLPDDMAVGDVYKYIFKGVELDWWDWGGKEEHAETTVIVPCSGGKGVVQKPRDNDGRPKLVVPASNAVEFTIM